MFGKPEWFRPKKLGWGLTPVCWQGWVYALIWAAVIASPFYLFIAIERYPEAGIWLVAAIAALVVDVRKTLQQMKEQQTEELFHIGDDQAESHVQTKNFDLHMHDEAS